MHYERPVEIVCVGTTYCFLQPKYRGCYHPATCPIIGESHPQYLAAAEAHTTQHFPPQSIYPAGACQSVLLIVASSRFVRLYSISHIEGIRTRSIIKK